MTVGASSCYLRSRFTCSPQRGLQCNARPAFCSANGEEQMKSRNLKILDVSAAITTGSLVGAGSSYAHGLYGSKQWVPRRHFVGIKEERRPPKFKRVDLESEEEASTGVAKTIIHVTKVVKDKLLPEEEGFTMRATGTGASGQVTLPGMKSTIAKPQPIQSIRSTPAWVPIMATAVFIMVAFWRKIRDFFGANGGRQSGRWIRDRSLGGKMVFIADDEVTSSSQKASSTSALPDAFTADGVRLSQQLSEVGSSRLAANVQASTTEPSTPIWWVYTPPLPIPESTKLEYRKRAKGIVKQLENQKLLDGKDYDMLALIRLYQACKEGGTDVAAAVATSAGREAMFRQGVRGALTVAADGTGVAAVAMAQSFKPREFVCGLAFALGVSEGRAIHIVHAVIAAEARGRLLDMSASRRKGDRWRTSADVQDLVRILQAFPLPSSAAEASLVGAALQDKITLAEMEELLKSLALEAPDLMELFTVMLGFDVDLTLPMLERYIAESGESGSQSSH